MNNNEFEYSEKTKRRVRIFKRILSFIVLILAIATMVALFYVKKEKMLFRKWQIHPVGSKGQIKEKHLFQYSPDWH